MEDQENVPNPNPRTSSLCVECGLAPWKYRCPGCPVKSCCLDCVRSHKKRTGCTGKRNRTGPVPLSEFNDNLMISDYNLLEETKRVAESARRMAASANRFRGYVGFRLPVYLQKLRKAASLRNTKLLLLPPGMSKRETNRSRYDSRKRSIFWTIEWRFHSTNVVIVDHGIDEHMSLSSVIEKHLAPTPLRNPLRPYRSQPLDKLKFFIRKTPKGLKSPFRELNIRSPIGQQLEDVLILEYPVIFVFLPYYSYDFEVEKGKLMEPLLKSKELAPVPSDTAPSPKGTLFAEEEIDDDPNSDTIVTDLAQKAIHDSDAQLPNQKRRTSVSEIAAGPAHETAHENTMKSSVDAISDFEQELREAYSELHGGINPDDFLCFDGEADLESLQLLWRDDELEEGEIPVF